MFFHAVGYSALLHHKIGLTIIDTHVYTSVYIYFQIAFYGEFILIETR